MIAHDGSEDYEVFSIDQDGSLKIHYEVRPDEADDFEEVAIKRREQPHYDFSDAWMSLYMMAIPHFCEMEITPEEFRDSIRCLRITFMDHKDYGAGLKIKFSRKLKRSDKPLVITTPAYFELAPESGTRLTYKETRAMERLKLEAFLYAYRNKRLQATLEEATQIYANLLKKHGIKV